MDHGVVSGGRGYMVAAGLGVCVASCRQTFQTKPDTSAARGRLCGRDAGVRQVLRLRSRGSAVFYIPAVRPAPAGVVSAVA